VDLFVSWVDREWSEDWAAEWLRPFDKPYCAFRRGVSCEEFVKKVNEALRDAKNCEDLMHVLNGSPLSVELTTLVDEAIIPHAMYCGQLSAMGRLHPAKVSLFDPKDILKDIYDHLDITSIPWSLAARTKMSEGATFALLKRHKPKINVDYIYVYVGSKSFLLRPLLMGALSEDGPQVVYAEFQEDTHPKFSRQTGVVFLVRDKPGGPIRATPVTLQPLEYSKASQSIDNVYWGQ